MEPNEKNRMLPAEQGVYTLLGFAQKAGCLFGGSDVVAQAVSRGQARLVLLAWDLSDNSYRRFWQHQLGEQAANRKMQVWRFGTKQQLGQAVGKPPRGIWALQDESCSALTGITLSDGIPAIYGGAFNSCKALLLMWPARRKSSKLNIWVIIEKVLVRAYIKL